MARVLGLIIAVLDGRRRYKLSRFRSLVLIIAIMAGVYAIHWKFGCAIGLSQVLADFITLFIF